MISESFYIAIKEKRYNDACDFLLRNPDLVGNMTFSELNIHYKNFKENLNEIKIRKLNRVINDKLNHEDKSDISQRKKLFETLRYKDVLVYDFSPFDIPSKYFLIEDKDNDSFTGIFLSTSEDFQRKTMSIDDLASDKNWSIF